METLFGKWRLPSASALLSVFFPAAQARELSAEVPPSPSEPSPPTEKKRVLIDLSHGVSFPKLGYDTGSLAGGRSEAKIVDQIGEKLKARLEEEGYEVVLSRGDESGRLGRKDQLLSRARAADAVDADMFVSLHANSNPSPRQRGVEIYFSRSDRAESRELAQALLRNMGGRKTSGCRFVMLEEKIHGDRPAVLIETGYLTNTQDRQKLLSSTGQDEIVTDIVSGIDRYFLAREPVVVSDTAPAHGLPPMAQTEARQR